MKITELREVTLGLQREGDGFHLSFTDKNNAEVIWIRLGPDVVKQIVEKLTSGIQVASRLPLKT